MIEDQALAIVTRRSKEYASTHHRLKSCLDSLAKSEFQGRVIVVDDSSDCENQKVFLDKLATEGCIHVVRREHGGVSRAKNTALVALRDSKAKYLFLCEEGVLFSPGWNDHYVRSMEQTGIKLLSYACPPSEDWQTQSVVEINHYPVKETNWLDGYLLAFTPDVVHTIGGFANLPASDVSENINWIGRAIAAGLTSFYADALGSNQYIRMNSRGKINKIFSKKERVQFTESNEDSARCARRIFYPVAEFSYAELLTKWVKVGGSRNMVLSENCWNVIESLLNPNMRTLETGSGLSTWLFAQSVDFHQALENHKESYNRVCMNRARGANVTLCSLVGKPRWYDFENHKHSYDLILIDGPSGRVGRWGILPHLDNLTHQNTVIVLDDTNRNDEARLALAISERTQKPIRSFNCEDGRSFSIID